MVAIAWGNSDVSICDILFVLYLRGLWYFSHFLILPLLRHAFSILGPVDAPAHCQHTLQGLSNWPSVNLFLLKHRHRHRQTMGIKGQVQKSHYFGYCLFSNVASYILYLLCQGFVGPELRVSLGLFIHTVSVLPSQQHLRHKHRGIYKGETLSESSKPSLFERLGEK